MGWDVFNILGTIAFALSGAMVALEERYDILGVFVLGFVTTFGGGMIRNLIIGIPVSDIWQQSLLFKIAFGTIFLVLVLPFPVLHRWRKIGNFFDAVGLSAFAIQGGLFAQQVSDSLTTTVVASLMTGIGGGMIRDVLANRKPLVLRDEIYALWAIADGVFIALTDKTSSYILYILWAATVAMRLLSIRYRWRLPGRFLTGEFPYRNLFERQ